MFEAQQIQQRELSSPFMLKVFWLVWYAMWVSALAVYFSPAILSSAPFLWNPIISLILLLWIVFTWKYWATKEPLNLAIFTLLAWLLWVAISPLIWMAIAIDPALVFKAFVATACLSFAAWVYWVTTKKDLSWMWWFLMMAVIWLIIVWLLNMIWPSSMVSMLVSWVWVVLFSIFIAHDVNTLKNYPENMAVMAAIWLYLSIFNLFQSILSLLVQLNWDD